MHQRWLPISRDTREQLPYSWPDAIIVEEARAQGLGDYGNKHPRARLAIDRKQLRDFAHWLVNSKNRRAQIDAATARRYELRIVVECTEEEFWADSYVQKREANIRRVLAGDRLRSIHVHFAGSFAEGQRLTRQLLDDEQNRLQLEDFAPQDTIPLTC